MILCFFPFRFLISDKTERRKFESSFDFLAAMEKLKIIFEKNFLVIFFLTKKPQNNVEKGHSDSKGLMTI